MVQAGLCRCITEWDEANQLPHRTYLESATRAERLARIAQREVQWWAVMERWLYAGQGTVSLLFVRAVIAAGAEREQQAKFWQGSAADWQRRAAGEQLCGVIGCGCDGECGVSA